MASIVQGSSAYAEYRAETKLLNNCRNKYGDITNIRARNRFLRDWFNSRQFRRSGLLEAEVREATADVGSYIAFLGTYMNMVASAQGRERWIDSTPSNANCLPQIADVFPNARVIHMVRDGRAVALSLAKLGWSGTHTDNFDKALSYAVLKWQVAVDRVYEDRHVLGENYLQIKYEDLVSEPEPTLAKVSRFLEVPTFDLSVLNRDRAQTNESVNSTLHTPNSLFGDMTPGISANAAYRWKKMLTPEQIALLERSIGETLEHYDYDLTGSSGTTLPEAMLRFWRRTSFSGKRLLKRHTLLGRFSTTPLEIGMD